MRRAHSSFPVKLGLIIGAILASATAGLAQQDVPDNESTRSVVKQILDSKIYNDLLEQGYTRSHEPQFNLISSSTYQDIRYTLEAGYTYQFLGKCDNDCDDLDLKLFDSDGTLRDYDTRDDDYPLVSYTPRYTRTFTLRVIMASCATPNCWSGVVALRK
jgi:hypothetical protein